MLWFIHHLPRDKHVLEINTSSGIFSSNVIYTQLERYTLNWNLLCSCCSGELHVAIVLSKFGYHCEKYLPRRPL